MWPNVTNTKGPKVKAQFYLFLRCELDGVSPDNGEDSSNSLFCITHNLLTHVLCDSISFITDKLADVFGAVHCDAFPTKAGYPLLGKKVLFGDGEILYDKIIKNITKRLLYQFVTTQDKGKLHETVDATHGAAGRTMLELEGEGCDERIVIQCNRRLLTNVISFITLSATSNCVANNLNICYVQSWL